MWQYLWNSGLPMLSLLLDTTQETLMLALADDQRLLVSCKVEQSSYRYHSAVLLPELQRMLSACDLTPQDIQALGVNCGPGSFTGIRTGLTVARVMGQFLPIQTYGFTTFELIAAHSPLVGRSVSVYLNAFRQQHYHAALQVDAHGNLTWIADPQVRDNTQVLITQTDVAVLDQSLTSALAEKLPTTLTLQTLDLFTPRSMLFYLRHQVQHHPVAWAELRPFYLQMPHITVSKASAK